MTVTRVRLTLSLTLLAAAAIGQELLDSPGIVRNWSAPRFWTHGEAKEGESPLEARTPAAVSLPTSPLPFVAVKPCRIVDTRSATFPPSYGAPSMAANVARDFALAGQCGIPLDAQAVSLNITATGAQGGGYILIYPYGSNPPGVSTLNYSTGQTVANAAVVALGNGGISVIAVVSGTQLLIDTNGYYAAAGSGFLNTFLGEGAGNFTMTGGVNTGIGANALALNTTGFWNAALGESALTSNTEGQNNAACGRAALYSNTTGSDNTAVGNAALFPNIDGSNNTAVGSGALQIAGTGGSFDTAIGITALIRSSGSYNTAVGWYAGTDHRNGDHNLYLGSPGANTESGVIRIGDVYATKAFFSAVRGVGTGVDDAIPVLIDSAGQLGTLSSSARFKEEIEGMADQSDALRKLRPVTFRYKGQAKSRLQYGLIAEEVETVLPELVVYSADGRPETVLYHELPAMLVNELQKQERRLEQQNVALASQQDEIRELRALLRALDERLRAAGSH